MNSDLLELLEEARIEIEQMWKTSDKSVADYIISLETAYKFVDHALKTEDRLDIFKALQKAYDVLEKEESYEDGEEYEESLPERIKKTLESGSVTENIKINKKDLKPLIKFILSEIMLPQSNHPFDVMGRKLQKSQDTNPLVNDIRKAYSASNEFVNEMVAQLKIFVKAMRMGDSNTMHEANGRYMFIESDLLYLLKIWFMKTMEKSPESEEKLDKLRGEIARHITQIRAQMKTIHMTLTQFNDVTQAYKQLQHLNEIFNNLKSSIQELFQLSLQSGLGKKK